MILIEERRKVIEIALKVKEKGLVPLTFGNFSLRDAETNYICITPSGINYEELCPADIAVVDVNGCVIEGRKKPSVETPMHCMIYRSRQDVFGICHTHSTFATAWASCEEQLPVLVAELAALVGETVPTAPYRPLGTRELAEVATVTLADKQAILLGNHGLLAVGEDLKKASDNAVIVEEGARIAAYAQIIGKPRIIPLDECGRLRSWALKNYGQKQ